VDAVSRRRELNQGTTAVVDVSHPWKRITRRAGLRFLVKGAVGTERQCEAAGGGTGPRRKRKDHKVCGKGGAYPVLGMIRETSNSTMGDLDARVKEDRR